MFGDIQAMMGSYESRKVDRYEQDGIIISTARVTDSEEPYETAISHPNYNGGKWIIVQTYISREESIQGHLKWVGIMTDDKKLPQQLEDVSTACTADWCDIGGKDWRTHKNKA